MTEITEKNRALTPAMERFILHWGDMGQSWGVNRSVAQIHALLLISERPLNAEEISTSLEMARSNVSNSLKDLVSWDLVRRAPIRGDRRDHFVVEGDMWAMITRIAEMRKAREIDPAKAVLTACLEDVRDDTAANGEAVKRLEELESLIALLDGWYAQVKDTPKETLVPLIRMGSKAIDFLGPFIKRGQKKSADH